MKDSNESTSLKKKQFCSNHWKNKEVSRMKSAIYMILPRIGLPYAFNKNADVNCRDVIAVNSDIRIMSKLLSIHRVVVQ